MRGPASLRLRLALGLSVTLTALWLAVSLWTVSELRHEMEEVFDSALQETAQRLLPLAATEILNRDEDTGVLRLAPISEHEEYFTYVVRDPEGRILMQSHAADPAMFPPWDGPGFHQDEAHRFYNEATLQGAIRLTVAEPMAARKAVLREIVLRLGLPLVLVIPLTIVAVVLLLRLGLAGLTRFREGIARRGVNDLSPLAVDGLPTELRPIADTVNGLLSRLGDAFDAERSFAANAAHELRTPLAGAIAQVQRLKSETADAATIERADIIEATLKRLTHTSERLMQMARAEGARLRTNTPTDLRPVLRLVAEDFMRSTAPDRIIIDMPAVPVTSDLDPDALAIVVRNLIDNALRHGKQDGAVVVRLARDATLAVSNDGPVISAERMSTLTGRFVRGSAAEGSGLGLAIVAAIARRLEAPLELASPRPGSESGFAVTLHLSSAGR